MTLLTTISGRRWLKDGPVGIPIATLMAVVLAIRVMNVAMVQSYFVPDEFWQGPEVAHRMVYGSGHLTWEWNHHLRGALHPSMLALAAKCLGLLDMSNVDALFYASKAMSVLTATLGDYATLMLTSKLFGAEVGLHALVCQLLSWCYFYTMSRTLSNGLEASLSGLALSLWPWPSSASASTSRTSRWAIWIAALSFAIRPTGCVLFAPLVVRHLRALWKTRDRLAVARYMLDILLAGCTALGLSAVADRWFYGEWTFPAYNFVIFNVFGGGASIYGVHPWHWYLSQGLPCVTFTSAPLVAVGLAACGRTDMMWLILWVTGVYSLLPHKEFRFILQVQHLVFAYAGTGLAALQGTCIHTHNRLNTAKSATRAQAWLGSLVDPALRTSSEGCVRRWLRKWGWLASVTMLAATNLPVALYLSSVHQRGAIDVMGVINAETRGADNQRVLFLMPCHSTPFYSHANRGVHLSFLDCSPEGLRPPYSLDAECAARTPGGLQHGLDEADRFYKDPRKFLECAYPGGWWSAISHSRRPVDLPTHVVAFEGLIPQIQDFLAQHKFRRARTVFHTHFALESRLSQNIIVYRRD